MRNLLLNLAFSLMIISTGYSQIDFHEGTWTEIKQKALDADKIIMIDAYTTWCGPCKWMAANTFMDTAVGNFVNTNFIAYKMDMEKGEGLDFAKEYEVKAYPTILYIDGTGKLIHKSIGASASDKFLETCKAALDPAQQLFTLKERYATGDKDKKFLRTYLTALGKANERDPEAFETYWQMLSEEETFESDHFWMMMNTSRGFEDIHNPLFIYFRDHYNDYEASIGRSAALQGLNSAYNNAIYQASKEEDEKESSKNIDYIKTIFPDKEVEVDALINYRKTPRKNTKALNQAKEEYLKVSVDYNFLNSVAWDIYENSEDSYELEKGLSYAERSVAINPEWMNLDTKAALLYKLARYDEAMDTVKEALAKAEEQDFKPDTSDTEELKGKIAAAMKTN